MSKFVIGFSDGFVGALQLAAAIVVGITSGAFRFFSRLGKQFDRHEPLR